jgi:DMATS type aromatic prenyltransferase
VLANHKAALQLTKRIASVFALNLSRLHTIADLLCPPDPQGLFTLWHGVSFRENEQPSFKVYLNPRVRGKSRANELVTQALERLGFHAAARMLGESLAWRAGNRDEISYLSLDLSDRPGARVKIYFAHHHVTAAELDRIFSAAPTHTIGEVTEFCLHMVGHAGPFNGKPVTSCFSFVDGSDQPLGVTLHLPISHYAESDDVIAERVESFLRKHGMNSNLYRPMIQRYSTQPTSLGTGIQSYASYRQDAAGMKLTTYLSPRLYQNPGLSNALQQVELPVAVSRAHSELLETRRREDERFRQRPIRPNDR